MQVTMQVTMQVILPDKPNSRLQKYQLYLPDREELRRELELTLKLAEDSSSEEQP